MCFEPSSAWKSCSYRETWKDHIFSGNYRPITLLPIIGKIFEKCILSRLQLHEKKLGIFVDKQFGFREKHYTTQQVVRIVENISFAFNKNKLMAAALIDIEKRSTRFGTMRCNTK